MNGRINVAHELLRHNCETRPNRVALLHYERQISYRELAENVSRFGNSFLAQGMKRRDRIVIQLPDRPECVYAFLGSIYAGLWPVLISPDLKAEATDYILRDSNAVALLTDHADSLSEGVHRTDLTTLNISDKRCCDAFLSASPSLSPCLAHPDDITFMLYSSGSTGNPKGVPHRHADMLFCADAYGANVLGLSDADRHFSAGKLFFAYGLGNSLFLPFRFGASTVLCENKPTPAEVFRIIETYKPTLFFGVPALYSMLAKAFDTNTADMRSLRLCVSAGEALPAAIVNEWKRLTGLDVLDGIGSTEALHIFISNYPGQVRPGSSGQVVPAYEAKVVNDQGHPTMPGEPGNLMIKGGSATPYYWNSPAKSAETMVQGGWLKTGDIYLENEGSFTYQGRADDVFKVDARWVSPPQVEGELREHPSVRECAVTSRRLEGLVKTVAHVVLNSGFVARPELEKELRLFVRNKLPEHMCPVQVEFRDSLPRTDTGKIQRFRLRQSGANFAQAVEAGASATTAAQSKQVERIVMQITPSDIVNVMKQAGISQAVLDGLKMDVPLVAQGLDSIDLPAVAAATEKQFKLDLSDADAAELKTVNDYVRFVSAKLN